MKGEIAEQLVSKVRDDYNAIADSFSDTRVRPWPEMEAFKQYVQPGDRVLDVGCGNGRAYQLFAGKAIEYEGIDASESLIAHAKKNVTDLLANFRVGDMTALPYESASFDVVMAIASLHHIPSREKRLVAVREMQRVLKPGGRLLMTNWDLWRSQFWMRHLRALPAILAGRRDMGDVDIPWNRGGVSVQRYYHAFTRRGLAALLKRGGFTGMRTHFEGGNLVTVAKK